MSQRKWSGGTAQLRTLEGTLLPLYLFTLYQKRALCFAHATIVDLTFRITTCRSLLAIAFRT